MTEKEFSRLLKRVISETIKEMKAADLIKETTHKLTAAGKTEELLRKYPLLKAVNGKRYTVQTIKNVEKALEKINSDDYYDIIPRYYFEGQSAENIALDLNVSAKTVRHNKQRLIDTLATFLFSDDTIRELYSG